MESTPQKRTFDEVLLELIELMDNPMSAHIPAELKDDVSQSLANIKSLPEFFKLTMGADMRRYFSASPDEQKQIRGAFLRTAYLLSLALPKQNMDFVKDSVVSGRLKM